MKNGSMALPWSFKSSPSFRFTASALALTVFFLFFLMNKPKNCWEGEFSSEDCYLFCLVFSEFKLLFY